MNASQQLMINVAVVALAVTGFTSGETGQAHAVPSCGFEFTWTRPTVLPPQIVARGVAQCTIAPEEHIAVLKIEFRPAASARWQVASATEPVRTNR